MTEQYNREQRLAEIRSRQAYAAPDGPYWAGEYSSDVSFLLSEIDRLQQETERMKIALHSIYNANSDGDLAELHGTIAGMKAIAHIALGVSL